MIKMEEKDTAEGEVGSPRLRKVAVALNGGSKSKFIVRWAIEIFVSEEGNVPFKLLHVFPKITGVPTPMGNMIPLPQVREEVVVAYKKEVEWQKIEMIRPYQKLFSHRKVLAEVVLIESDEITNAISMEIAKHEITDLVIGASSNGMFGRKMKGQLLSSLISECIPSFCTVYVVSKGKLESLRPSDLETNRKTVECDISTFDSTTRSSTYTNSSLDPQSSSSESPSSTPRHQLKHLNFPLKVKPGYNNPGSSTEFTSFGSIDTRAKDDASSFSLGTFTSRMSSLGTLTSQMSSAKSITDSEPWIPDQSAITRSCSLPEASTSKSPFGATAAPREMNVNIELEKLRIELRHIRGMYAIAQNETVDATRRLSDLNKLRHEEAMKLREISEEEEKSIELARLEKEKFEAAKRVAEYARERTQLEAFQRREAELTAAHDIKEKERLKNALVGPVYQYQKFSWEEIVSATFSFNEALKIGEGSYGTVYKCMLHHTNVAIKVLHSKDGTQNKQFHRELDILSKIRHPHLLLLLGACPEHGCLVYEYMKNGSLEDRLFCKNHTPPIPWFERFRIAWEVASALVFLHNNRPKPIIHRDLKPDNILLDHNFVSKIGDAGLCTMLNLLDPSNFSTKTLYKETSPVGTFCYIDPEYQRTGLISTKSDVYALGMVILQLLTAKPAVGIARVVEDAISDENLTDILDKDAGRWPVRETAEMALLGVQCAELRRRDRPDMKVILSTLERLKLVAEKAHDIALGIQVTPPSHFICPILKEVMEDPCVASDGYTYDRKAIEMWFKENDTSPTTNFPLANKNLIPNYTLLYAIVEWKSKRKPQIDDTLRLK